MRRCPELRGNTGGEQGWDGGDQTAAAEQLFEMSFIQSGCFTIVLVVFHNKHQVSKVDSFCSWSSLCTKTGSAVRGVLERKK